MVLDSIAVGTVVTWKGKKHIIVFLDITPDSLLHIELVRIYDRPSCGFKVARRVRIIEWYDSLDALLEKFGLKGDMVMPYKGIDKIDAEAQKAVEVKKTEMEGIKKYVEMCVEYRICPNCGKKLSQICMINGLEKLEDGMRTIGPNPIMTHSGDLRVRLGDQCVGCGWLNIP